MKKVCVSMMAVCLTVTGLLASPSPNDPPYFEQWPEEMVASHREAFKDAAKLREHLEHVTDPSRFEKTGWWLWEQDMEGFGRKFNVSEEALEEALLDVYRISPRYSVIRWLGFCAGEEGKKVLWDIANDSAKTNGIRSTAIIAYIQRADALQVRDALVRFLIDVKIDTYSTYLYAFSVYDGSDAQKREAIAASLAVTLAREEGKGRFADMDKRLAQRSKDYAESSQRKAMVDRMSKLPPGLYRDTDPDLKTALESFKTLPKLTSVSTNLTELMACDFRKPPEKKE